jgi:hypothetical protein
MPNGKPVIDDGCYLIRYVPADPSQDVLFFEGTARVMRVNSGSPGQSELRAGADLYCRLGCQCDPDLAQKKGKEWLNYDPTRQKKNERVKIPIFARKFYRYYLQITKILEDVPKKNVSLSVSVYEFKQDTLWRNPGSRWVCLTKFTPTGYKEYFEGNVLDQDSGQIVGTLTMCKVSERLRRATVVIHCSKGVKSFPGYGILKGKAADVKKAWKVAFEEAGWEIRLDLKRKSDLQPADGKGEWTIGELQQALHVIHIRQTVPAGRIKTAENKQILEKMTPLQIQKHFPDLSRFTDPLDTEWVYQLLCVPRIDGFDRGVMFDPYGSDSENLPREGAAVAAEWKFGADAEELLKDNPTDSQKDQAEQIELMWGTAYAPDPQQLQAVHKAYFRVGVHEIGHAMGLGHNFKDDGFMNTTDSIAEDNLKELNKRTDADNAALQAIRNASLQAIGFKGLKPGPTYPRKAAAFVKSSAKNTFGPQVNDLIDAANELKVRPFPWLIKEHFQADDLNRLRFGPDVTIRPGTSFNDSGPLFGDEQPMPAEGLKLKVSPLLDAIPFGAPARIKLRITNTSSQNQKVPISLSLKTGVVTGSVVDPDGIERTFWPLKKWEDSDPGRILPAYESRTFTMTLLRGAQKALFPVAGDHRVKVRATWQRNGKSVCLDDQTIVHVNAPIDDNHRATALKILSTPDTLFSVAIIGDHLIEGNKAVQAAVDNPILRPHFAVIRAKLLLTGPRKPPLDLDEACDLIDDSVVMSFDEIDNVSQLLCKRFPRARPPKLRQAVICLDAKLVKLRAEGSIEDRPAQIVRQRLKGLR